MTRDELKDFFHSYLHHYFTRRDFSALSLMLGDELHGVGSGLYEVGKDRQASDRIFQQDIREAPESIEYEILSLTLTQPNDETGFITSELNLSTCIEQQPIRLKHLRVTLGLTRQQGKWVIQQLHASFPTQVHEDDESYPIKELREQKRVLEAMVSEKTAALERALKQSVLLANTDQLTGLKNRSCIDALLLDNLHQAKSLVRPLSIILLDVDHFKQINDSFGHQVGDEVLKKFASILKQSLPRHCEIGRWGGEEFLITCANTSLNQAVELARSIQQNLLKSNLIAQQKMTASFGVAALSAEDTLDSLLLRADRGLYQAKHQGRNQIAVFSC